MSFKENNENDIQENDPIDTGAADDKNFNEMLLDRLVAGEQFFPKKQFDKKKFLAAVYDWAEMFCYALVLTVFVFLIFVRYVTVDGESMLNTLKHEDKLIISDLAYTPKTGDIVIVKTSSTEPNPYVKRIIATGGQTVTINVITWEVIVDGVTLDESYVRREEGNMKFSSKPTSAENGVYTFTVDEGKIFVMGDNRQHSKDSRDSSVGQIDARCILGKVLFRIYPLTEVGIVD